MSHFWPEILRITLCPDQVVLERGRLMLSLTGVEPHYREPEIIPVQPEYNPTLWAGPLAVLSIALDGLNEGPYDARVILSNHFAHYPLVSESLAGASQHATGTIDDDLRTALQDLLEEHDCRLTSLQPRIVALGTSLLDEFQGEPGWLVVIEDGLACLGLIQDWEFVRLRNLCLWPASSVELLTLLDHEAALAGFRIPPRTLILWKRDESDEVILPFNNTGWHIITLGEDEPAAPPPPRRTTWPPSIITSARAYPVLQK